MTGRLRSASQSGDEDADSDAAREIGLERRRPRRSRPAAEEAARRASHAIAGWLRDAGYRPDVLLCSSSLRTRETAGLLREAMPTLPRPVVSRALYHAGPEALLDHLRRLPVSCEAVLLVAHQPGIGELLRSLGARVRRKEIERAYESFPTAAVAVLEAEAGRWADFGEGAVDFVAFAVPREVMVERDPGT